MAKKRKKHTATTKARVAVEALRERKTVAQIASQYQVSPTAVTKWKQEALKRLPEVFERAKATHDDQEVTALYEQIGRLQVELAWLKKMAICLSVDERRRLVEPENSLSIVRQCELLDISRAGIYYEPKGETALNLELMRKIDEQYTKTPFYGSRKITEWLRRKENYDVNRKRVQRLMRLMGIEAIYQKPRNSIPDEQHKVYPYLLRDFRVERPNQVWATDITYVPLRGGFVYLVAILDRFSRYVISWELSNRLDRTFCLDALDAALERGTPDIFNTDQGCQFTSADFTDRLKNANVLISMDGRGRCFDNIFTERLWRTVKYEDIYINDYDDVPAVYAGLNTMPFT